MTKIDYKNTRRQMDTSPESFTPTPPTILFFREDQSHGIFSNFSDHGITVTGTYYKTVEHFYQSAKFINTDPFWAQTIVEQEKPILAFYKGQDRRHRCRPDWEAVKDDVMRFAVMTKAVTHSEFREDLLKTSGFNLIENNPKDAHWGCGRDGQGKNMLGKILMEIRDCLSHASHAQSPEQYIERARLRF